MSDEKLGTLSFGPDVARPDIEPPIGRELYRTDSKGRKVRLVGEDYNRALWENLCEVRQQREYEALGYVRSDAAQSAPHAHRFTKSQLWETPEEPLVALEYIPMDPEAGSFAGHEEYEWARVTDDGKATLVANLGGVTEYPQVDNFLQMQKSKILKAVIAYSITHEEERKQARMPYNILDRKARWARRAIERTFNDFLLRGGFGNNGLFNFIDGTEGFNLHTPTNADWYLTGATSDEIIAEFIAMHDAIVNRMSSASVASSAGLGPDTVIMAHNIYSYLDSNSYDSSGGEGSKSILRVLQDRMPQISNWYWDTALNTFVDSNSNRILMYRKSPDVLAAAIPTAYQEGVMLEMPHFKRQVAAFGEVAPLVIHDRRPTAYMDVDFAP